MVANDWLAQDLADMLNLAVERPAFVETTALGAAMLAGVGCGMFSSLEEAVPMRGNVVLFEPRMAEAERKRRLHGWRRALGSEEHTSELQSLMRKSYAVFCLQKKT